MSNAIEREGCDIRYWTAGQGPHVLLIQGVGVIGEGWRPQIDALSKWYTCVWFDNRGMGQSQPQGQGPLTVEQMAADAAAVMDAAGVQSAHVVGHSLGGLVATHLAATSPGRVKSLSLLCTFLSGREAAPLSLKMIWLGAKSRIGPRASRRRGFLRLIMAPTGPWPADPDTTAKQLEPLFGHDLADQPPIVSQQLKALRAGKAPDVTKITVPSLVVSATEDPIAPPKAGRVLATALRAKSVEIGNASHGVVIQHADRVNALLEEHFAAAD